MGNTYIIYREAVDVCGRFGKYLTFEIGQDSGHKGRALKATIILTRAVDGFGFYCE